MRPETIAGGNGYDIPCLNNLEPGETMAVIVSHGLGSSKDSSTFRTLSDALPRYGIGTFSFDFPGHGDSPADGEFFRIGCCLNDLAAAEARVREILPGAEIGYFSSSFGAYLNLIYLAEREHRGHKSFLRSAAVDLPRLFRQSTSPEQLKRLEEQGWDMLTEGFERPLKITRGLYDDLERYDVFRICRPGMAELFLLHGTDDKTAPVADVRRFAERFGAAFVEVEGAGHRFLNPGGMDRVAEEAVRFFTGQGQKQGS